MTLGRPARRPYEAEAMHIGFQYVLALGCCRVSGIPLMYLGSNVRELWDHDA